LSGGEKRDRTARLLRVAVVLNQNPHGLTVHEIARLCNVCVRTTYRDLRALQEELEVPIWQEGRLYGLVPGYFLPPVNLTLQEAMALFLASRLTSRYADERDPYIESAFTKLGAILPQPIAEHVQETVKVMAERRANENFARVFDILTTAWARCRRVRIGYLWTKPDGSVQKVYERLIDPYFIEPSGVGHSCYVIGFDHFSQQIRTFKVERIHHIELTNDEYVIPIDWSAGDYLRLSWGIVHDDEVEVRVRFSRAVAARVKEAIWHPTQQLQDEPDGSVVLTVRVAGTMEITPWILSWGAQAEVLSPPSLRDQIGDIARKQAALYGTLETAADLATSRENHSEL